MRFTQEFIDEAKARVPISEIAANRVRLVRAGARRFKALCPFHSEKTPSFTLDDGKGVFYCHGCGAGGGSLVLLQKLYGLGFAEAVEEMAKRAGMVSRIEGETPKPRPLPPPLDPAEGAHRRQRRRELAWKLWQGATRLNGPYAPAGCAAHAYDRARRITMGFTPSERFLEALPYRIWSEQKRDWIELGRWPALVAAIVMPAHTRERPDAKLFVAVQVTWLAPDGSDKARPVDPETGEVLAVRKVWWEQIGGAIRLGPMPEPGGTLLLGEGRETVKSVMEVTGYSGWAAISLHNLAGGWLDDRRVPDPDRPGIILPAGEGRRLVLLRDADTKDLQLLDDTLARAAARHGANGWDVRIATPPPGMDFNDWLRSADRSQIAAQAGEAA